jgi:hypothetical protein
MPKRKRWEPFEITCVRLNPEQAVLGNCSVNWYPPKGMVVDGQACMHSWSTDTLRCWYQDPEGPVVEIPAEVSDPDAALS